MPQATSKVKKPKSKSSDSGDEAAPSAQERAESGIKLAQHVQTALTGGKIRKAFALWGAAKQLRVAAAGTGGVVKKHPLATPSSAADWQRRRSISWPSPWTPRTNRPKTKTRTRAIAERPEDSASDEAGEEGEEQDDQEQDKGEEDEPSGRNSRNGARQRVGSRGR
jgi:hypothetical protein